MEGIKKIEYDIDDAGEDYGYLKGATYSGGKHESHKVSYADYITINKINEIIDALNKIT